MKKGDFIYYKNKNGDTCPAVIEDIKGSKIKIENNDFKTVWVNMSNCELQSEAG